MSTGYCHPRYAQSFAEFGRPRELPSCGGWLVERDIPRSTLRDAMGCYPLFDCSTWSAVPEDLARLGATLVSVSLVTSPFADVEDADLRRWFDVVTPFKQHYVIDLGHGTGQPLSPQHRRTIRKALRSLHLETCPSPLEFLDEWCRLYSELALRHRISGIRAFSRAAFEKQLTVPGLVMFRAVADNQTVGLHLWYVNGDVAYGHLGATSARGYELSASYALYWRAIEHFRDRVRWLDLGAGAGVEESESPGGLLRFKAGWATGTRIVFLCGRVLQRAAYETLVAERVHGTTTYFPAYRAGEFSSADPGVDVTL
jgi:hypothetical protein